MFPEQLKNKTFRKSFLGAALGTLLEYYDYALFSIFMPIFAPLFFPASTVYESLSKGFLLLLIPISVRPLGALFFGHFGDLIGRRRAMLSSMYGIALATLMIGLIPSCQSIGPSATLILILAKTIQVFCFGGEYNGAGIYVVEHAQNKNEGVIGALLAAVTITGSLLATLFAVLATFSWMPLWSWRLAFILGGIAGFFCIHYRKNLLESPQFKPASPHEHSFSQLLKNYPLELSSGIFMGGMATSAFTTVLIFVLPILMTKGLINNHQLMLIQTFLISVAIITVIPAGYLADRFSPPRVLLWAASSLILLAYPLLWLMDQGNLAFIIFASTFLVMIVELIMGPSNAYLKNIFSLHYRYRGSSLSVCLGMALFGGLTPIIENSLYRLTGSFSSIAGWLILLGLGGYLSISLLTKRHALGLEDQIPLIS